MRTILFGGLYRGPQFWKTTNSIPTMNPQAEHPTAGAVAGDMDLKGFSIQRYEAAAVLLEIWAQSPNCP